MLDRADQFALAYLLPLLAVWIALNGVDDLCVDILYWVGRWRGKPGATPAAARVAVERQKWIAIYVPLWQEAAVIGRMLRANLTTIAYERYHVFCGVYPNDEETRRAVEEVAAHFSNLHLAICPDPGPTSKADNLNTIHAAMKVFEEASGVRFAIVVTHDAEDVIHPLALARLSESADQYDMAQIPVLPLPTPLGELTHGIYCDEFAQSQVRDLPVRARMGAFVPSCGVGTGVLRGALDRLEASQPQLFDKACLTEDYELGWKLRRLGCRQTYLPVDADRRRIVATREYFPRNFYAALRQRTRWVMGIALQGWERHGWEGSWVDQYWLWRDRKGLLGHLASLAANLVTAYGLARWGAGANLLSRAPVWLAVVIQCNLYLQLAQLGSRFYFCRRVYGTVYALGIPFRAPLSNVLNACATGWACWRYAKARLEGCELSWLKTTHQYAERGALSAEASRFVAALGPLPEMAESLFADAPPGARACADYLVAHGVVDEERATRALAASSGLRFEAEPERVHREAVRALPARVVEECRVVPYRIERGSLVLAASEPPPAMLPQELARYTRLKLRFALVTPGKLEALRSLALEAASTP